MPTQGERSRRLRENPSPLVRRAELTTRSVPLNIDLISVVPNSSNHLVRTRKANVRAIQKCIVLSLNHWDIIPINTNLYIQNLIVKSNEFPQRPQCRARRNPAWERTSLASPSRLRLVSRMCPADDWCRRGATFIPLLVRWSKNTDGRKGGIRKRSYWSHIIITETALLRIVVALASRATV